MSASAAEVGVGREVICADGWRVTMHVEVRRGPNCKGQIVSARDQPGCQQQCSLVVPTVRATTSDPDRAPSHLKSSRRSDRNAKVDAVSQHQDQPPARCSDRRPAADEPDPAPATAPGGGHRWPGHRLRDHLLRVSRMAAASATHPTAPQAPEPFRDPPGEAIGVALISTNRGVETISVAPAANRARPHRVIAPSTDAVDSSYRWRPPRHGRGAEADPTAAPGAAAVSD